MSETAAFVPIQSGLRWAKGNPTCCNLRAVRSSFRSLVRRGTNIIFTKVPMFEGTTSNRGECDQIILEIDCGKPRLNRGKQNLAYSLPRVLISIAQHFVFAVLADD